MSTFDLSALSENYIQYEKLVSAVEEKNKCNWDDVVHDSYGKYVKRIREYANEYRTIIKKAEIILKEVQEIDIPGLISHADELCKETNEV